MTGRQRHKPVITNIKSALGAEIHISHAKHVKHAPLVILCI